MYELLCKMKNAEYLNVFGKKDELPSARIKKRIRLIPGSPIWMGGKKWTKTLLKDCIKETTPCKTGTNKFQEDYIEYLEECNANLQEKLVKIREFQNRILNDRIQNRHYDTTLKEVTNVCNATCEAIDNLFENFTATMNSLKIVLLWKSQISQLPEKLSYILKSGGGSVNQMSVSSNIGSGVPSPVNEIPDNKNGKKCGTAKVSPMIDGHVISTPRIHLNRVSEDFGLQTSRSLGTTLSPIIEASPSTSPHNDERPLFRETRISLQRLQLDNFRGKASLPKVQQNENNVTNGEGSGFRFRKPYDSLKARYQCRLMRKKVDEDTEVRNEHEREIEEREGIKDDAPNNVEPEESSNPQVQNSSEEADPLEGPSWLLDMPQTTERNSSDLSSFQYNFINFKRPNYSSFSRASNDEDMRKEVLNFNENARMGNFESVGNEIQTLSVNLNQLSEAKKLSNASDGSLNEESLSASHKEDEFEGNSRSDISDCNVSKRESLNRSTVSRNSPYKNSLRSHNSVLDSPQKISPIITKESFRLSCADPSLNKARNSVVHTTPKDCLVIVNKESCESAVLRENNINKKRKNESLASSCTRTSKSSGSQSAKSEDRRKSSGRINRVENPVRVKRRAAELCYQRLHNLEIQMREGSLPKSKKRSREKKKKSKVKY